MAQNEAIIMTTKERYRGVVEYFSVAMPTAESELDFRNPFELLVAVVLSAQCTDKRVNMVTPDLFKEFPTPQKMAVANINRVEELIKTCGLYKTKAKDLILIAQKLMSDFGGVVPDTIEELTKLPGVGRKTANLILGDVYKLPAVVADTHLIRITNLIGLVETKDPKKVVLELKKIIEGEKSNDFCHRRMYLRYRRK